jgi:urease accessory protein
MDASALLTVALDARGLSVPTELRAEAPLLIRVTAEDAGAPESECSVGLQVHLVGGAAGPLGGDRLSFVVDVQEQSRLTVRSVGASLAQPGHARAGGSTATVRASVAPGAILDWWPEPIVSVIGSEHTQTTVVDIDPAARLVRWVDEMVLGRHGEPGGRLVLHQRVTVGGVPLLRHTATFDPRLAGIGRHGRHRVAITGVVVGHPSSAAEVLVDPDVRCVRYPLSDTCTAWIALADDLDRARRALGALGLDRCVGIRHWRSGSVDDVETST